jgi:hypothetical protein
VVRRNDRATLRGARRWSATCNAPAAMHPRSSRLLIAPVIALALAAGCNGTKGTDHDGDGFSPDDGDCDDSEPSAFPGSVEVCDDGIDNDCQDGDAVCYTDVDGDGVSAPPARTAS